MVTEADIKFYPGVDGNPINNTDPLGGAISTTAEIDEDITNSLAYTYVYDIVPIIYYSVFYIKNEAATGVLENARLYNKAACMTNTAAGAVQVSSTSGLDAGKKLKVTGYVSGDITSETIVLSSAPVIGSTLFDASGIIRFESLDATDIPIPFSGNITISVDSEIICVLYGSLSETTYSKSTSFATTEYEIASATAINTAIGSANRLTAPTGLEPFVKATVWPGGDESITLPGGELAAGDYIGFCVKFTAIPGMPTPVIDFVRVMPELLGTAT